MGPPTDAEAIPSELSPLLGPSPDEPAPQSKVHSPYAVLGLLLTLVFIIMGGSYLCAMPATRIMEDIICHRYYEGLEGEAYIGLSSEIDESLCKGTEVQSELSTVLGVLSTVDAIPSILFAFPYGFLAERIGRKKTFILCTIGIWLSAVWLLVVCYFWRVIPIRAVWAGPIFQVIGGGSAVASACLFSIVADITTDANRTNFFLWLQCGSLAAELLCPSIAAALMRIDPWIPAVLGTAIVATGPFLILFIPETLHVRDDGKKHSDSSLLPASPKSSFHPSHIKALLRSLISQVIEKTSVLNSTPIIMLSLANTLHISVPIALNLALRYISKRYTWALWRASILLSVRAFVNLILLFALLPYLSLFLCRNFHFTPRSKDIFLARISIALLALGSILLAASPTVSLAIISLIIFTLGNGLWPILKSLASGLVEKEHAARLLTALAVAEALGAFAAGPGLAQLYNEGLRLGGGWIGLPFYVMGLAFVVCGLGAWLVRLPDNEEEEVVEGGLGTVEGGAEIAAV